MRETSVPEYLVAEVEEKRNELIENLANLDDRLGEWLVNNDYPAQQPPVELLKVFFPFVLLQLIFVIGSYKKNYHRSKTCPGIHGRRI